MCVCAADAVKPKVEHYLHSKGFPVKVDDSKDGKGDPPAISSWIGRDVKKFLNEAHLHLPALLWFANVPDDDLFEMENAEEDEEALRAYFAEMGEEYVPCPVRWRSTQRPPRCHR